MSKGLFYGGSRTTFALATKVYIKFMGITLELIIFNIYTY